MYHLLHGFSSNIAYIHQLRTPAVVLGVDGWQCGWVARTKGQVDVKDTQTYRHTRRRPALPRTVDAKIVIL